jgi:hypothetical protein
MGDPSVRRDVAIASVLSLGLALPLLALGDQGQRTVRLVEVDGAPVAEISPVEPDDRPARSVRTPQGALRSPVVRAQSRN